MPYYRHAKNAEPETGLSFATMPEARDGMTADEKVTFVASAEEREAWTEREYQRFKSGAYFKTPWAEALGYRYYDTGFDAHPAVTDHYAHLSIKHPGLVAYTKSAEHGVQDRQTAVKPGKYLAEYYAGRFSDEQIAAYIAACKAEHMDLKLATSTRDIVAIYSRKDLGFTSCMQFKRSPEYPFQVPTENGDREHPVAVYGESDLAVAYLGEITGKLTARSVVWPDQKLYTRVYGDETLTAILKAHGYRYGSLRNAKVRAIRHNGDWILPYIDGIDHAEVTQDKKWIVLGSGPLSCSNTSGYGGHTTDDDPDDCDYDTDDDYYTCERCDGRYDYGTQSHGALNDRWCDECIDDSTVCNRCDTRTWEETTHIESLGEKWCDNCLGNAEVSCDHTAISYQSVGDKYGAVVSCGETWVNELEFTADEHKAREALGVANLCREHALHVQKCKHCDRLFDCELSACVHCGLAVRCESTARLFETPDYLLAGSPYYRAEPEPRRRLPETAGSLREALNGATLEFVPTVEQCHIHDCHLPLAGTWAYRASYDLADGMSFWYCVRCAERHSRSMGESLGPRIAPRHMASINSASIAEGGGI